MKSFKTIQEQIELLRSRNLTIDDESIAYDFLLKNNYYRISGYSLTLRHQDLFYPSTSFQNIIDIYNFDHEFRMLLWNTIQIIEITVKSIYAYYFTMKNSPTDYLDSSKFTDEVIHKSIIDKVMDQKDKRKSHEAFIQHYVNDLNEDMPLWVAVDLFTFSDISKLYSISKGDLKKDVASELGLHFNSAPDVLKKYLHSITILRNLCAHESRIYNRLFITKPSLNRNELSYLRDNPDGTKDNSHVFGYLFNIKRLVDTKTFSQFKTSLIDLTKKYPFVDMRYYGFCEKWDQVL
ncbi:MAG: Abi family protein [Ruminococcus sp.]|nr:Abi family protein [Ruminococcus sp.]